jgi:mono/diheme cytochrome c family protein
MEKSILINSLFIPVVVAFAANVSAQADLERGKSVYNGAGACMSCHGVEGAGDGPASAALSPKPASFKTGDFRIDATGDGTTGTEEDLYNVITNGAQKYGGSMMMVGRADLSEEDRRALVAYVLSLKE